MLICITGNWINYAIYICIYLFLMRKMDNSWLVLGYKNNFLKSVDKFVYNFVFTSRNQLEKDEIGIKLWTFIHIRKYMYSYVSKVKRKFRNSSSRNNQNRFTKTRQLWTKPIKDNTAERLSGCRISFLVHLFFYCYLFVSPSYLFLFIFILFLFYSFFFSLTLM